MGSLLDQTDLERLRVSLNWFHLLYSHPQKIRTGWAPKLTFLSQPAQKKQLWALRLHLKISC